MEKLLKILTVNNLIESQIMDDILNERKIPHIIKQHSDSVYPSLFNVQSGWGHIEAPLEFKDEILEIYNSLKSEENNE